MSGERQLTSSSLVKAEVSDIPELVGFLIGMHDEAETLYPPYDKFLMSKFIKPIVDKELCILLKKDKKIIGAIGGQERRWWFSHNKYLGDAFFFINKKERNYQNAYSLVKSFQNIANRKMIPCLLGTLDGKDLKRKADFYKKLGLRQIGNVFADGV